MIEAPPQSWCVLDDFWFRYVADMGIAGPDKGVGGKYLFVPPGHEGELPDGYYTYQSSTYSNWVVPRALGGVPAMKQTRIYPLAEASAPDNEFINLAEIVMNTVHSKDFSFFEELDELIQEEPLEALDAERAGQLAAIGLAKGKPFAPDERMRGILSQAAQIGAGMARTVSYADRLTPTRCTTATEVCSTVRPDLETQRVRTRRLPSTPAPEDTLIAYRSSNGRGGKVCCCHSNREASSG